MKYILQLVAAALVAFILSSIASAQTARTIGMTPLGVTEKSAHGSAQQCFGTYVTDTYDQKTGERLAVIVIPTLCGWNWMYYGNFGIERTSIQVDNVVFHMVKVFDDTWPGPFTTEPEVGGNAYILDNRLISINVNGTSISAYPNNSFASGRVASTTSGIQVSPSCTSSGCTYAPASRLDVDLIIIDRGSGAHPGTAVVNDKDELIGVVLGADADHTVVLSMRHIFNLMYRAGLAGKGVSGTDTGGK